MSYLISNMASYPPEFRPTNQPGQVNDPSDHSLDQPDPLPVIDMARLDEAKLHVACKEWGVFRLVNHGVPESLIDRLQTVAKSLLDLDFETKRALLKGPNPVYSWGSPTLTATGVEIPKGSPEVGLEIFRFKIARPEIMCQEAAQENAITTSFKLLATLLEQYGEQMTRLAKEIFKAMAKNLKLDQNIIEEGNLHKYIDETSGLIRVNRYPPYPTIDIDPQVRVKGLDAHTDSTVLTILLQDNTRGLELLKDGLWLPVRTIPSTLIVNVGDMLQAMSDDEYKSAEHKVTLNKHRERISVGYFVFPEDNTLLTSSKGKYRPFTNKDFRAQVQKDFANFGTKVGLPNFRV